jgi:hypothetical protein
VTPAGVRENQHADWRTSPRAVPNISITTSKLATTHCIQLQSDMRIRISRNRDPAVTLFPKALGSRSKIEIDMCDELILSVSL